MKNTLIALLIITGLNVSAQNSWLQKTNLSIAKQGGVSFAIGNFIYYGTGNNGVSSFGHDFWAYDITLDTWSQVADYPANIIFGTSFTDGTYGYVGLGLTNTLATPTKFYKYDPTMDSWNSIASFAGNGRYTTTAFCIGGFGYVGTGNDNNNNFYDDFWEYDISNDSWTQRSSVPGGPRCDAVAFEINGMGYLGTGASSTSLLTDFYQYEPYPIDAWTQKASLPGNGRADAVGLSICERGYIGFGYEGTTSYINLDDMWEYDAALDQWIQVASSPGARMYACAVSIGGKGYVMGGTDYYTAPSTPVFYSDIWEYTPNTYTVRLFIEGYYGSNGLMDNGGFGGCLTLTSTTNTVTGLAAQADDADIVTISAMDASNYTLVEAHDATLKTNGIARVTFTSLNPLSQYYIMVNHRNALETWSAGQITVNDCGIYDFTTGASQAYGNNMSNLGGGVYGFYSGDISDAYTATIGLQDDIIESQDDLDLENALAIILFGYVFEDITGDGIVESADDIIMENNIPLILYAMHP